MVEECSNGSHVAGSLLSHGFSLMPTCLQGVTPVSPAQLGRCYMGAATSKLSHSTGARAFVCQIEYYPADRLGLSSISCARSGTFPALGDTFRHDCWSDDAGSPGSGDSGTGLGNWRCNVSH